MSVADTELPGLRCPACRLPLDRDAGSLRCATGHTFDLARQGYAHLLLSKQSSAHDSGDDGEMVRARRAALSAGYYAPVVDAVSDLVSGWAERAGRPARLLDLGCGEGTVLREATERLLDQDGVRLPGYGVDASKRALRSAAGSDKRNLYVVASTYDLPLDDASIDVAVKVFSPAAAGEVVRVLRQDGIAIAVNPGADHLIELRERMYETVTSRPPGDTALQGLPGMHPLHRGEHARGVVLHAELLRAVVGMTPYRWSVSPAQLDALAAAAPLTVTTHFVVTVHVATGS